jgi:hypothetical protein
MRILLAFPVKDGQTGVFIQRAFQKIGHKVKVVDAKIHADKLVTETKRFLPDMVFCSRTIGLLHGIRTIKNFKNRPMLICWNVDKKLQASDFKQGLLDLFAEMDIFYTIALGNVPQYQELFGAKVKVKHLQQGCDPAMHKTETITQEDLNKYTCDAFFAGSTTSCGGEIVGRQRTNLFDVLNQSGINFKRFGDGKPNRIVDAEHNKACMCAKVSLGHNGWAPVSISMSVRDYKIMGAGGFLLTQYCQDIEKWFKIGKECDIYKTPQECVEKIQYYLNHEEERQRIAQNGQKIVYEKHKYIDRMRVVLDDVNKFK